MEVNPGFSDKAKEDYKLVEAAKEGDQKAYAELLGRYRDAIYFMILKMINNKSDAEDLTIEAFGKAFKNIQQYSSDYAFSTWLFKIASNNCIDYLRKNKIGSYSTVTASDEHPKSNGESEMTITLSADGPDPEETMIKNQKAILMRNIVQKLKPRYRRLIELRYFNEFSYEEIASELELPLGTVKAQLFRARELLYNTLKKSEKNI